MKINVVCVGGLKEKSTIELIKEYEKRISRFHAISIIELPEEKLPKNYSMADVSKGLVKEGIAIEKNLVGFVIVLDKSGIMLNSEEFAKKIDNQSLNYDTITFVIGSSYGISENIKARANMCLSFSKMTFPHQLFRVMLMEQIYRAATISNNIIYHK